MKTFFTFIKKSFFEYAQYGLWLFPVAILIRLFEALLIYYSDGINLSHLLYLNFKGGFYDIFVFSKWALIVFPVFALLYKWRQKVAAWVIRILFALILGVAVSLIIYFVIAGLPLDSSVLNYSFKELYEITTGSGTTAWWAYWCIILFPAGYLFVSSKKLPKIQYLSIIFLITMLLGWWMPNVKKSSFNVAKDYNTVVNKGSYWFQTLYNKIKQQQITLDGITEGEVLAFQSHFPELTFVNPQYPFLHTENTPDRLSPFFQLSKEKPNIVIIIVEGLARTFSGKNTKYPSPTPYINSLAEEGLSWDNCFSTSGRTFGVLPALLGSLPYGISGFLTYQQNAPNAHTLTHILADNGYTTSFFHGGSNYFDGMGDFLYRNGVKYFLEDKDYEDITERNYLGIHDDKMFQVALKNINFSKNKPRLDIYLTLTSHDPFDFPNEKKYIKQYSEIIDKSNYKGAFSEKNMKALSSFLYVDDAVKELIDGYRQKSGFENTIFVITGDHNYDVSSRFFEITHVPFVIWSPMLAKNASFPAVVSHREFTPSLLTMLRQQYRLKTPEKVAWLNTGLDTCRHFESINLIPQMSGNRELVSFFYKNHFVVFDQQCDIIEKDGDLDLNEDYPLTQELAEFINAYKKLDRYVMDKAMLLESEYPIGKKIILLSRAEKEDADIYILEGEFPLNFIEKVPLASSYNALSVEYEFEIKVEGANRQLRVVTEIVDGGGKSKYWTQDWIVKTGDFPTDEWFHYEFHQTYKTENYNFKTNDLFSVYLWDVEPAELKIYIKNLKVKLMVII